MVDRESTAVGSANWATLCRIGGASALLAGLIFRRNLAAELALVGAREAPGTPREWFALLQEDRLLGLAHLNVFDLVNYLLVAVMFLALYVVLRQVNRSWMTVATVLALLGIAAYLASSPALSMLSLGDQYSRATSASVRTALISSA